jgi:hypothetical protein
MSFDGRMDFLHSPLAWHRTRALRVLPSVLALPPTDLLNLLRIYVQNEKVGFPGSRTLEPLKRAEFDCGQRSGEVSSTAGAGSYTSLLFQACRGMRNANPSLYFRATEAI